MKSLKTNPVRLGLGILLLTLSIFLPLASVWIVTSNFSVPVKTALVGAVTVGGPEVLGLAAIALLGKECFDLILSKLFGFLNRFAPKGSVGKTRYKVGLIIMILSYIPSFIYSYAPHYIPDYSPYRLYISVAADMSFIASLFILGGDFWDKLRSLFVFESKAVFESKEVAN